VSKNLKLSIALVGAALAFLGGFAVSTGEDDPAPPETASERDEWLVRPDSPRLTEGGDAVFVEFLDFECEACGAIYPTIEELKDTYGDQVTFVVRHMPLHVSSVNAARAAEAAGAQGEFEAMYDLLFQRPTERGHQDTPEEARFFDDAEEIGLDMEDRAHRGPRLHPHMQHQPDPVLRLGHWSTLPLGEWTSECRLDRPPGPVTGPHPRPKPSASPTRSSASPASPSS